MSLLTDLKARKMSPGGPAVPHGGVTGLTLLPSSSQKGHGKWVLRYVSPVSGKRRNAGLGSYPEVGIASVGKLAREMREQIARGLDPLDLRAAEEAKHRTPTFKEAASQMHTELKPGWRNAKHAQQWINTLEQYVFPKIGSVPLDQISPRHIAEVLRPIWLEKAETASRLKQRLHAVMAWGWAHGFNQANPVDVVPHLLPGQPSKTIRQEHQPAMPWKIAPSFIREELHWPRPDDVSRFGRGASYDVGRSRSGLESLDDTRFANEDPGGSSRPPFRPSTIDPRQSTRGTRSTRLPVYSSKDHPVRYGANVPASPTGCSKRC